MDGAPYLRSPPRSPFRLPRSKRGFTLIELLVSIAILAIMVLAVSRIITDATHTTQVGYRQSYDDGNARAILDMVMDDLMQCMNDRDIYLFRHQDGGSTYNSALKVDQLMFVSMLGPDDTPMETKTKDTLKVIKYWVDQRLDEFGSHYFVLLRGEEWWKTYADTGTDPATYPIVDHVVEFKLTLLDELAHEITSTQLTNMPAIVQLKLATISEENHNKAIRLTAAARDSFIDKNSRRYFTQAYLPMRIGRQDKYNYK